MPVDLSTFLKQASFSFSPSAARSYMARVTAMVRPLQVPQQEMTTNTKIRAPPTWPKMFWNAILAPASPPSIITEDSTAPARPI